MFNWDHVKDQTKVAYNFEVEKKCLAHLHSAENQTAGFLLFSASKIKNIILTDHSGQLPFTAVATHFGRESKLQSDNKKSIYLYLQLSYN